MVIGSATQTGDINRVISSSGRGTSGGGIKTLLAVYHLIAIAGCCHCIPGYICRAAANVTGD
ncbi:MAG: hypothetical protein U5L96_03075 [Owenweeksia sp.]|nr:hypothetical protein [Owenweeksia sp.]